MRWTWSGTPQGPGDLARALPASAPDPCRVSSARPFTAGTAEAGGERGRRPPRPGAGRGGEGRGRSRAAPRAPLCRAWEVRDGVT